MREFFERDEETGMISFPETPLFPDQVKGRAKQIMKALDGLKVCSALRRSGSNLERNYTQKKFV